jgi:DNA-binding Lrp family transcriptional regulator
MHVQMERHDGTTIGEWTRFLAVARAAGATEVSVVEEVAAWQDDGILTGYKVATSEANSEAEAGELVTIPAGILEDLLYVARQVARSDGDVRGLEGMEGSAEQALTSYAEHVMRPMAGSRLTAVWAGENPDE